MDVAVLLCFGPLTMVAGLAYDAARSRLWQVYYREPTHEEVLEEMGW